MVQLTGGKGSLNASIPGVLVGIPEASPFISALMSYTAKMDSQEDAIRKRKADEETGPIDDLCMKIKAFSLFPSIYRGQQYHRTFNNVRTDDIDGEHYNAEASDVKSATRRTRRPGGKKSNYRAPKKQEETVRNPELVNMPRLK